MKTSAKNEGDLEQVTFLFTVKDIACRLQVSERSVRRWIGAGDLVVHRLGDCIRVSEADLARFLERRRAP